MHLMHCSVIQAVKYFYTKPLALEEKCLAWNIPFLRDLNLTF